MTAMEELLQELHGRGIRLRLDGDQLAVSAPRGSLSPQLRQRLTRDKPTLIDFLRGGGRHSGSEETFIRPRSGGSNLPMSFAQQRLWFFEQLEGPGAVYNIPMALLVRGSLDEEAVCSTVHEIVTRHEVLRTSFALEEGQPRQYIHAMAAIAPPVTREKLVVLPGETSMQAVHRLAAEEAAIPFDLQSPPPAARTDCPDQRQSEAAAADLAPYRGRRLVHGDST